MSHQDDEAESHRQSLAKLIAILSEAEVETMTGGERPPSQGRSNDGRGPDGRRPVGLEAVAAEATTE